MVRSADALLDYDEDSCQEMLRCNLAPSGAEDRERCFSRPELIKLPQSPRRLPVLPRTHQFGNLANVPQIVHGLFMHLLLKRDLSRDFVHGLPSAGTARQRAQELGVGLALLF